jgi:DNA-binding response OmpR family regulator
MRNDGTHKLLVVDDDDSVRRMMRESLSDGFEVVDTSHPEEALALALEHKPDAILLDLRMPKYSGFQLCQTLANLNSTQLIPIVIVSAESGAKTREICRNLGAADYFEKPVDFDHLRKRLRELVAGHHKERRAEVRVRLRATVRVKGRDLSGDPVNILTTTENVARGSFLCTCAAALDEGSSLEVFLPILMAGDDYVGLAKVVRSEWNETHYPRYACRFSQSPDNWVLH